ncbi:hypothetical protein N4G69_31145 [Streptomyces mirabilis]|uniref:hypothetical protein n=1 Tax=Streptomyces mirabilis TaxID=68239 RepID=UPI0021BE7ED2|nr:hypothetical protein [Streptomyces mirabilis]MCT9110002.1 hypothetical protein [Streptomyces mirabilis]
MKALFELQAWLGHRSPESTQHYAKISPNTLTKAYDDAGYFARNIRTIEVPFFEQCPHRMTCARCDFYTPKESGKAQLLEAKDNLQRMRAAIPLTDGNQRVRGLRRSAGSEPAGRGQPLRGWALGLSAA